MNGTVCHLRLITACYGSVLQRAFRLSHGPAESPIAVRAHGVVCGRHCRGIAQPTAGSRLVILGHQFALAARTQIMKCLGPWRESQFLTPADAGLISPRFEARWRHSVRSGLPVASTQSIMRHSDIRMTNQHYTDVGQLNTAASFAGVVGIPGFNLEFCHQSMPVSGHLASSPVASGSIPNDAKTCSSGGFIAIWRRLTQRGMRGQKVHQLGLEPSPNDAKTLENTHISNAGQPLGQPFVLSDAEFAKVAAAWPTLPDAIRRAIMALVETAG